MGMRAPTFKYDSRVLGLSGPRPVAGHTRFSRFPTSASDRAARRKANAVKAKRNGINRQSNMCLRAMHVELFFFLSPRRSCVVLFHSRVRGPRTSRDPRALLQGSGCLGWA